MIFGLRIKQAREFSGLTQVELADKIGVKQSAVAQMESGVTEPTAEHLKMIAAETGFTEDFFSKQPHGEFPLGSLQYRARRSESAANKLMARRHAELMFEASEQMVKRLNAIELRIPRINEPPQIAAQLTRSYLGLSPDEPIAHVINVIELSGVVVLGLPVDLPEQDAFSLWIGNVNPKPLIALAANKPGDRVRFSASHELGHLVMHSQPQVGSLAELEKEANLFAGEFLLPETAMRRELHAPITLTGLTKLKARWKVAVSALVERAKELEIITTRQHRYLRQQMAVHGLDKREGLPVGLERPRAFRKMAELLYGQPPDDKRMAADLGIFSRQRLRSILAMHDPRRNGKDATPGPLAGAKVLSFRQRSPS